jgi:predicted nucleic acid-binding protein
VIVLDTNVISELMRAVPDPRVLAWAAALAAAAEAMFAADFAGRILPFGAAAAARYPGIVLARRRAGNPIEGFDALIAATALAAGAGVATRDTGGFAGCGLMLIDPWMAA